MGVETCPFEPSVVDYFDHNSPEYGRHRYDWYKAIREEKGPVFWSPQHGGFWVVIGWPELTEAAKSWEVFSSNGNSEACPARISEPDGMKFNGLFIPPRPSSARMLEEDPPTWRVPRKALTPIFAPGMAEAWRPRFQQIVDACIDRHIESGRIDFAADLFDIVPAIFSLELVGVDTREYKQISRSHHLTSHLAADEPAFAAAMGGIELQMRLIANEIERQKPMPAGTRPHSAIAALLDARDAGAEFSDDDIKMLCALVIGGGIDTTSAMLGTAVVMLSENQPLREQFNDRPEIIEDCFNEFMRIAAPTAGLARTATRDTVLGGQQIRRGDRVMLCWAAANRDPREFSDPETVVLDRRPNRHVGFGSGNHRCIGAHYAKVEFEVIMSKIFRRMPDFQVDVTRSEIFENVGIVAGWKTIPASFAPGLRLGVDAGVPGWEY